MRPGQPGWDDRVRRRVGQHIGHGPLHIRAQCGLKLRIGGKPGVISGADEAVHEPAAQVAHVSIAGVQLQQCRMVAARLGVGGRPAHHLGPISGQPLDVLRAPGMRERMVELGILQAALVVGRCQGEESRLAPGEGKQ